MAGVTLRGLGKVFPNGVEAVSRVDLEVGDGELFAVVGPSGSGKSTILRMLAGLETPTAGSVWIGGRDVTGLPPRDRDVAMVFQDPALFPYLNVFDNLAFGLRARGAARAEVRERVEQVAEMLELSAVLARKPATLSGGQRQRVALGRAVVRRPAVFLFDEPLSGLDAPLRASVRADLIGLHRRLRATMIHVTHDQGEALAMADRLAVVERGRVVQAGRPEEVYRSPATRFVGGFVGSPAMNLVRAEVVPGEGAVRVEIDGFPDPLVIPDGARADRLSAYRGRGVEIGVRPEHVAVARPADPREPSVTWLPEAWGAAEVVRVEFQGHESVVVLGLGPQTFRALAPGALTFRPGEPIAVGLDLARASWFDPETGRALDRGAG